MFNIPMNTKPSLDLSSFASGSASNQSTQQTNPLDLNGGQTQQPMNQGYNQQQNYGGQANQGYGQQQPQAYGQPMNQGYNQQPQQNYSQPVQQQQNYSQPVQQSQPVQHMQQTQRPSGGGVILKKGQKVHLAQGGAAPLTNVRIGLGWDVKNQECDLDASVFLLGADGKVIGDDWFVFYGQTNSPDNCVIHSGDSKGQGTGDDETIDINLANLNPNVKKITFVVTINEAIEKGLNFSMVANAYVRVMDKTTGNEIMKFNLSDYYANVTAMVVGEVYNHNGTWKFNAVGDGVSKDLYGLCEMYGVNVAG